MKLLIISVDMHTSIKFDLLLFNVTSGMLYVLKQSFFNSIYEDKN